ncbi:hypothetical protein BO86DRAFT_348959 [Aspergillus japonicus CBS 114.51]|uniref:Uncharacterized protein n=2 Tax=Aspergillus TaxID=5052 RepID=A0A2V5ICK5_ASPV1|nr:hypothetical protein BO86DRAFT_348959 [Aspergillus japonicus CBS 114.51]PYI21737.1 hypothetical protein BO99DRAFT_400716 [Aspergillus violaceofuscus CBS 115571]RAH76665.1 hypothetical protein BO86DRAFT_348959 [Aspergillus japonicus CBS 114.51]
MARGAARLGGPTELRFNSARYTIRYQVVHEMPFIAAQQLALHNPASVKISHLYKNRPRDTLWSSFGLRLLLEYKSVVRSWAMGRSRVAFRKALADRGYDQDGRAISSFPRPAAEATQIAGLRGSIDFTVREEVITAKSPDIEKDMREFVDRIIKVMLHAPKAGTGFLKQRILWDNKRR